MNTTRRSWLYMFSHHCDFLPNYMHTQPHLGCGVCVGCRARFAQAVISLRTCQGLGDNNTVPYWHFVFKHTMYKSYCIDDWATIDPVDLGSLCLPTSCWRKASTESLLYIRWIVNHNNCQLPKTLEEIMQVYGMGMKSASLIIYSFYRKCFAVTNNRHVLRCAIKLDWV